MIGAIPKGQPAVAGVAGEQRPVASMPSASPALRSEDRPAQESVARPGPASDRRPDQAEAQRVRDLMTAPDNRVITHRDDTSGRMVITVTQRDTGEVVEQIPSDELLRLYTSLREPLVDEEV